ncbi:MAG: bifunctional adenosylcobinamide kinase/adenosylcobinamide-phosphate guanylyltransferase [Desulfobacteraceae bacterium]|nr:MAG: bifunctional adenosylcobinamide kinase/adenosylcobinamide-phosphate guanylyltransferase [Desulfobacteraceae bacterium]
MSPSTHPDLILVLGGARSGKSSFALHYIEDHYHTYLYLASAEIGDPEMASRVKHHRRDRGPQWGLVEEPLEIAQVLEKRCEGVEVGLVDCLTLWLSNILLQKGAEAVPAYQQELLQALRKRRRAIVLVANEVGLGIVPETPLGRQFRDLAGRLNQEVAVLADQVVFTVAGLPMTVKGGLPADVL